MPLAPTSFFHPRWQKLFVLTLPLSHTRFHTPTKPAGTYITQALRPAQNLLDTIHDSNCQRWRLSWNLRNHMSKYQPKPLQYTSLYPTIPHRVWTHGAIQIHELCSFHISVATPPRMCGRDIAHWRHRGSSGMRPTAWSSKEQSPRRERTAQARWVAQTRTAWRSSRGGAEVTAPTRTWTNHQDMNQKGRKKNCNTNNPEQ